MSYFSFFFFNDTATTEIYTLSLHDALPILLIHELMAIDSFEHAPLAAHGFANERRFCLRMIKARRSEEHTSELQSQSNLVCRLLLEKKKKKTKYYVVHLTSINVLIPLSVCS